MLNKQVTNISFKKLHPKAREPFHAHEHDAGFDLTATSIAVSDQYVEYGIGLAFNVPAGYGMFLFPRSSISKKNLQLANAVGVVDSGFLGEVRVRFRLTKGSYEKNTQDIDNIYRVGDRVCQAVILELPNVQYNEVNKITNTSRSDGSFGSSGE